jgi:hypothetical protein
VYDAEISTDAPLRIAAVSTFELELITLSEVGHGALQLGEDGAWSEGVSGEDAELRFARAMRVPLGMGNLDGATR